MPSSLLVRCEQCGHESAARYHFCGMCGAKLPPPQPPAPLPPIRLEPPSSELGNQFSDPLPPMGSEPTRRLSESVPPISSEPSRPVSGPSFLGLADDSTSSVSYLLEDELSESHWGRSFVLLLILIAIGFAGWHWRDQLRTYVTSRLAQHPNGSQGDQVSNEAPGSEVGAGMPNGSAAVDKPMTGVGDLPVTTTQNPGAPANQAVPPGAQNSAASQNSPPTPAASTTSGSNTTQSSGETPGQAEQNPTGTANGKHAVTAAAKRDKTKPKESAPVSSGADELEAQGEKYLYGSGAPQSCSLAQKSLQAAAEHGSTKANSVLGTMYATGHCVGRDLPLAYRWFAKALQAEPNNDRLSRDLQVLWNQMNPDERQIAMRR
jgi:hypothetical protein